MRLHPLEKAMFWWPMAELRRFPWRAMHPLRSVAVAGLETIECDGLSMAPGFIDQHIHITGAGGKYGYGSMTPEVHVTDLYPLRYHERGGAPRY